jgi:hypothetical protein
MHRLWVLVLALLALPAGSAAVTGFDASVSIPAGERASWSLEGAEGDALTLEWQAQTALDLFVIQGTDASALDGNATPTRAFEVLNSTSGQAHVTLASDGPWLLVADNTDRPAGGAPGNQTTTATLSVEPYAVDVAPPATEEPPAPTPRKESDWESPTLWNALMFDALYWDTGGPIVLAGVALWMILLAAVACIGFASPPRTVVVLAGAATLFVLLWALLPRIGELTEIGLPALAGLALAWVAVKRTTHWRDALQLTFVATVLGAFAGVLLAYALHHAWSDPGMLQLGGRRFVDVLFTLPGFGVLGVVLFKVIPDIVHAIDDANSDEPRGPTSSTSGQGEVFHVTCLRCKTEIKVDRSMKRFRVATDRFEFACPNCQYWMEWSDPNQPNGAAAA